MAPNISVKACRSDSGESAESFVHVEELPPAAVHEPTEHEIRSLDRVYMHVERSADRNPWENEDAVRESVGKAVEVLFGEIGRITMEFDVIRLDGPHALLRVPRKFAVALRCALVTCGEALTLHRMTASAHTICVNSERYVHK